MKLDVERGTNHLELEPEGIHDLLHLMILGVHERVFEDQVLHLGDGGFGPGREACRVDPDCGGPDVDAAAVETEFLADLETHLQPHLLRLVLSGDEAVAVAFVVAFLQMGLLQIQRRIEWVIHHHAVHNVTDTLRFRYSLSLDHRDDLTGNFFPLR